MAVGTMALLTETTYVPSSAPSTSRTASVILIVIRGRGAEIFCEGLRYALLYEPFLPSQQVLPGHLWVGVV